MRARRNEQHLAMMITKQKDNYYSFKQRRRRKRTVRTGLFFVVICLSGLAGILLLVGDFVILQKFPSGRTQYSREGPPHLEQRLSITNGPSRCSNRILNPGFENGLQHWYEYGAAQIFADAATSHSGSFSGYASGRTNTWDGIAQDVTNTLSIDGVGATDKEYYISFWVKLNLGSSNIKLTFWIKENGRSKASYHGIEMPVTNQWTFVEGTTTLPSSATGSYSDIVMYIEQPPAGVNYWVDDVYLVPASCKDDSTKETQQTEPSPDLHLPTLTPKAPNTPPESSSKPRTVTFSSFLLINNTFHSGFQNEIPMKVQEVEEYQIPDWKNFPPTCKQKETWHALNFATCNSFHEMDQIRNVVSMQSTYLDSGWRRDAWKLHHTYPHPDINDPEKSNIVSEYILLKTLKGIHDYNEDVFDTNRVDALVPERLTASPHIIDVYGSCGTSISTEFVQGGMLTYALPDNIPSKSMLSIALNVSLGLADIHEIDLNPSYPITEESKAIGVSSKRPSLVHHELTHKHILLNADGRMKIYDFNDSQFLRWDFSSNTSCFGFSWGDLCEKKAIGNQVARTNNRSPEECTDTDVRYSLSEKTEVYHLGSILHFLLTREPYPWSEVENQVKMKEMIRRGEQPPIPKDVEQSSDPAIRSIVHAMREAYKFNMTERLSAREISVALKETMNSLETYSDNPTGVGKMI